MEFEYDPEKSESNKAKHGIDFEEAQRLWADMNSILLNTALTDEERFLVVGTIDKTLWTAVITFRNGTARIISVRRSRKDEKQAYDNGKGI